MAQYYEIFVKSHIDEAWADWFEGLTITHQPNGETRLFGSLPDQAALHGVLNRLRDLGLQLRSVKAVEDAQSFSFGEEEETRDRR